MKKELSKKVKIAIGIAAFVIVMAAIGWIVALALLYTDIKTEVYGAEFDYVDNVMYDNAYITMKSGRWQLYRDGGAISRTFGHLEYVEDEGRFTFINTDGKGWGYVDTSGVIIVEFTQEYRRLLTGESSLVGVRVDEGNFSVRNGENKNIRIDGSPILVKDFPAFYAAYGDSYVVYRDKEGGLMALDTTEFEKIELPFGTTGEYVGRDGYLTALGTQVATYGPDLKRAAFLGTYMPIGNERTQGYVVVGDEAVLYTQEAASGKLCTLSGGKTFLLSDDASVVLTDGTHAVARVTDSEYLYFDGSTLSSMTKLYDSEVLGGEVHVFKGESDEYIAFDSLCSRIAAKDMDIVSLCRTKEKNRARYTVEVKFLVAGGKLYAHEDGEWTVKLENVTDIATNDTRTDSRIVTQSAENGTVIYDAFFEVTDRKAKMNNCDVIDPFFPVYSEIRENKKIVTMPRGSFEIKADAFVEIVKCTNEENYFAFVSEDGSNEISIYGKNGAPTGKMTPKEDEEIIFSETQIIVLGENNINVVTKERVLDVRYNELHFSRGNKYAVAVGNGVISVINLNDGSVGDLRYMSGSVEISEYNDSTFVFKNVENGLYGIISDGKVTLSPTYKQMKLHDGFVIASVDEATRGTLATYFQSDFTGKRISGNYYELECTEGLTIGKTRSGESEIMNARGRVILKHVTYVPYNRDGGFDFMASYVYDEETGRTMPAERRDNSRLLTVTAGGYKRVISITRDE